MSAPRPATLDAWLSYLETLHPKTIALGLSRVREVMARMALRIDCPVITVGGTNGKGSTCAMLEAMLRAAGYRTVLYTSPHLLRYNERVRIDGREVDDDSLTTAFGVVEDARTMPDEVPLTYFEFGTLAALHLFARAAPEVAVLEVGLGGRLDAVNAIDPDVSVITSIDIDHTDYLGPDRASIGREKAGIVREGRPAICGDEDPPQAFLDEVARRGATLRVRGRDFGFVSEGAQWRYWCGAEQRFGLPMPALRGGYQLANAATAIAALDALAGRVPVHAGAIRAGLASVELPGRFQVIPGRPVIILDVAHNPEAARMLSATLGAMSFHPTTIAVLGMLRDKDIDGVIAALADRVDRWHVAGLPPPRGASADLLRDALLRRNVAPEAIVRCDSVAAALVQAREIAGENDRIVVFGSFLTVAAALPLARAGAPSLNAHG